MRTGDTTRVQRRIGKLFRMPGATARYFVQLPGITCIRDTMSAQTHSTSWQVALEAAIGLRILTSCRTPNVMKLKILYASLLAFAAIGAAQAQDIITTVT